MAAPHLNLTSLGSINADGSRRYIHPADVAGPFTRWRRLVAGLLLLIYIALPWIPVGGYPAVFLDVAQRRFHFFGMTFATQDLWVAFFFAAGLGFSLFFVTSLLGRIWCGWTCPYTVFLEHVFRRVERWIDGDAPARRKLEDAPWTGAKIFKRVLKHGIFILLAALIAHIFLSYFVSIKGLYGMMHQSPGDHLVAFGVVAALTFLLYGCFSWFREQFCVIMCPYGRLQSALTDDNTVVIGYDRKRGEPRGKVSDPNAGDCVSCNRCVQVCPTGIDIRNGLQLECIGCAACVDACDAIMAKVKRPKGLVRYDSLEGLNGGKTRLIRPRTILYSVVLVLGMTAFFIAFSRIEPVRASAVRMPGAPYYLADDVVRNQFLVRVINKRKDPVSYKLELEGELPPGLQVTGLDETLTLQGLAEDQKALVMSAPVSNFDRKFHFNVKVTELDHDGAVSRSKKMEMLGPDMKLRSDKPLDAKDYIQ
ncbi:MAG: cytochrome c oxidase accessory protein CcoG [Verrucomicrobiales bacterium]|nr:cytochrome c oxidase accessory protein CcoG [Verrucomicrobiales bacterium]